MCYSKGEVIADGDKSLLSGENNGSVIEFELLDNKHYQNVTIIIHIFDDVKKSLGRIGKLSTFSLPLVSFGKLILKIFQKISTTDFGNAINISYSREVVNEFTSIY